MSEINLKIYPALNGDSFLIGIGDTNILIDGGYVNTFNDFISQDLELITKNGGVLSHVIVTHLDQDHISGIVKLFSQNEKQELIAVNNVWHNAFRHIQPNLKLDKGNEKVYDKELEELKGGAYLKEVLKEGDTKISSEEGSSLASMLLASDYNWNNEFGGKAVSVDSNNQVQISNDIKLILLSPNNEKLDELEKYWRKELRSKGYLKGLSDNIFYDDAFEFMTAKQKERIRLKDVKISKGTPNIDELLQVTFEEDTSPANGSSIAFILEHHKKKILFLGDSHPSLIIDSLRKTYRTEDFPIMFDIIKVSHHGSWSNTSPELLKLIDSSKYIFSSNGKSHNHPDEETIAHIITRPSSHVRELFFNYSINKIEAFNNTELKEKYNFNISEGNGVNTLQINL